jgi:hypothetical protein
MLHLEGHRKSNLRELSVKEFRKSVLQIVSADVIDADKDGIVSRSLECSAGIDDRVIADYSILCGRVTSEVCVVVFPYRMNHISRFRKI